MVSSLEGPAKRAFLLESKDYRAVAAYDRDKSNETDLSTGGV